MTQKCSSSCFEKLFNPVNFKYVFAFELFLDTCKDNLRLCLRLLGLGLRSEATSAHMSAIAARIAAVAVRIEAVASFTAAMTAHAATATARMTAVAFHAAEYATACTAAVTAHMHPFEPTAPIPAQNGTAVY